METIKTITLDSITETIFNHYADLAKELKELMPEDFESRAQLNGEMQGIKWMVELLSNAKIL